MRKTYRVLAYGIALGVAIQAASVALAFFEILHLVEDGGVMTSGYDYESNLGIMIHRINGTGLVPLCSIALLVVSFFTRAPGAVKWALIVFGLVVLQIGLVFVAFGAIAEVGALHGLNALVLLGSALWAGRRVTRVDEPDAPVLDVATV